MFDPCRLWRRKLMRLADGALPARQRGSVEDHLSRCATCRVAAEADRALRETLQIHAGVLDTNSARLFDDRVFAQLSLPGVEAEHGRRLVCPRSPAQPLAFLYQIVAGALVAATVTALCLMPSLHPAEASARIVRIEAVAEMSRRVPPVPLESLLQAASPCAALLWTMPRDGRAAPYGRAGGDAPHDDSIRQDAPKSDIGPRHHARPASGNMG